MSKQQSNGNELIKALNVLVEEKNISPDVVFEALQLALQTAYKKNFNSKTNVRVDINRETGDIKVYSYYVVVPEIKEAELVEDEEGNITRIEPEINRDAQILLEDAKLKVPNIKVGETIEEEVTPKDFGRVAAGTAKQVVMQKIREAEKNSVIEEFSDKQDELMIGMVAMEDQNNYYIDLGRTRGILPKRETIPGEQIIMGSNIKVYVSKVESGPKGPIIKLSRNNYGFVKRLFEHEIPEFSDGTLELRGVAREAGVRSKVAVASTNPKVDPIGSCIGEKGRRIANIINELGGEKVDLIAYSDNMEEFIANALSPAKNLNVSITDEKKKEALVIADDENLSLAIGKKGINIKLASKLTKYTINIKTLADINAEINK